MILIKNAHLKTMAKKDYPNGCLLIDDSGKIAKVAEIISAPDGAQIIDAQGRLVTPGCIDGHCHTGLKNESIGWAGVDHNESQDPITPQLRAIDGINPQDESMVSGIRGGVTTVCTGPGSGNVVGGTFAVIKLHGKRVDDMILKAPAAMKCAFGENPKKFYGQDRKRQPVTRMGIAAMLRELLFKAERYMEDQIDGKHIPFDMKLEAMLPVLRGEIPLKAHAHRADDILTSIRIAKEFGVKLTLEHCTDGAIIAEELAKEGYPAFVGPSHTSKGKTELSAKSLETAGILHKAGVKVCIVTDAPVVPLHHLPLCAGLAAQAGLGEEEAWKAITINPAEVLGVSDRVGSLEPGKDADVVIWTADPLVTVGAQAYMTFVNGKCVYKA